MKRCCCYCYSTATVEGNDSCSLLCADLKEASPSLLLVLKWGGELTPAGRVQAEELGRAFRCMYPGGQGESGLCMLVLGGGGKTETAADSILVATSKVGSFGKEAPFRRRKSVLWPLHLHQKELLGWWVESNCGALGGAGLKGSDQDGPLFLFGVVLEDESYPVSMALGRKLTVESKLLIRQDGLLGETDFP